MRRLGLGILAFVGVAGAAGVANAQVATDQTTYTFTATATIASAVVFDVNDDTVECGTINTVDYTAGTAACDASATAEGGGTLGGKAEITVKANQPYQLTVQDSAAGNTTHQATMNHSLGAADGVLKLTMQLAQTNGTNYSDGSGLGNETNGDIIDISPVSTTPVSDVQYTDHAGSYSGTFTISIAAQ